MARLLTKTKNYLSITVQKSTMSKEELKSFCHLLSTEDSWSAEPRPTILIADIVVSDNTTTPSNIDEPEKKYRIIIIL